MGHGCGYGRGLGLAHGVDLLNSAQTCSVLSALISRHLSRLDSFHLTAVELQYLHFNGWRGLNFGELSDSNMLQSIASYP